MLGDLLGWHVVLFGPRATGNHCTTGANCHVGVDCLGEHGVFDFCLLRVCEGIHQRLQTQSGSEEKNVVEHEFARSQFEHDEEFGAKAPTATVRESWQEEQG